MQLSIYLGDDLIRRVDRMARQKRLSRSRMISGLIEEAIQNGGHGHRARRILALAGSWKDHRMADEIVREIYSRRTRASRRAEMA